MSKLLDQLAYFAEEYRDGEEIQVTYVMTEREYEISCPSKTLVVTEEELYRDTQAMRVLDFFRRNMNSNNPLYDLWEGSFKEDVEEIENIFDDEEVFF